MASLDLGYGARDLLERGKQQGQAPACEQRADVQHQGGGGRRR